MKPPMMALQEIEEDEIEMTELSKAAPLKTHQEGEEIEEGEELKELMSDKP